MKVPAPHKAMECGRLQIGLPENSPPTKEISNMRCGSQNFGFICQIRGENDCVR